MNESKKNGESIMNQLTVLEKMLTMREFEGYLKGKIIEIRLSLTSDMPVDRTMEALELTEQYERKLQQIARDKERRNEQ